MVSVQTQRRIHEFEPQHVSNTLWACARMQLQEPLMLRALTSRAIEDIQRFCPLDISICTWAFATMKRREPEWLRAVVRARCEFGDFSPQNMSNFVWGLSTLGFRNDNMVLAVGREASKKIQDFIPQELSNFSWALATMDLCDNLMLRAIAEEVERRGPEVNNWDPQSLSNMMWAYATLALKDDPLFRRLLDASIERIQDHDTQNLANSSWAAAMVGFRCSRWLTAASAAAVRKIRECQTLHLAQLAFAFARFVFKGEAQGFLQALLEARGPGDPGGVAPFSRLLFRTLALCGGDLAPGGGVPAAVSLRCARCFEVFPGATQGDEHRETSHLLLRGDIASTGVLRQVSSKWPAFRRAGVDVPAQRGAKRHRYPR